MHFRNVCELKHCLAQYAWSRTGYQVLDNMQEIWCNPFHTDVVPKVCLGNENKPEDQKLASFLKL